jgi:hypothetical protein
MEGVRLSHRDLRGGAHCDDLRQRLAGRVQLTSDGHRLYLQAVEEAFGDDIDYAMLVKLYGSDGDDAPNIAQRSTAQGIAPARAR